MYTVLSRVTVSAQRALFIPFNCVHLICCLYVCEQSKWLDCANYYRILLARQPPAGAWVTSRSNTKSPRWPILAATWRHKPNEHTHTQSFNGLFSRTTWVGRYQKDKPVWILLKQTWWGGSGISWTICKSFALRSTQITTPAPHHSVSFMDRMLFLPPN